MSALRMTNGLLAAIAVLLLAHLGLAVMESPVMAETFRLDSCVTDTPRQKPSGYLHVVVHSQADVESRDEIRR